MLFFFTNRVRMHTKLETFQDKLKQLTEFNQALVYGFEPETSRGAILGSPSLEDTLYPAVRQYGDMLKGYLFAQKILLPVLLHEHHKKNV